MSDIEIRSPILGAGVSKALVSVRIPNYNPPTVAYMLHNEDDLKGHILNFLDAKRVAPGNVCIVSLDTGKVSYHARDNLLEARHLCSRMELSDFLRIVEGSKNDFPIVLQTSTGSMVPKVLVVNDVASLALPAKSQPYRDIVWQMTMRACMDETTLHSGCDMFKSSGPLEIYSTEINIEPHKSCAVVARYYNLQDNTHIMVARIWQHA